MPEKPFNYRIVRLLADVNAAFKKDDICLVEPNNWYGLGNNGWDKDDPERDLKNQQELQYLKDNPWAYKHWTTYWNQHRSYCLLKDNVSGGHIIDAVDSCEGVIWVTLNIDGKDLSKQESEGFSMLKQYSRSSIGQS